MLKRKTTNTENKGDINQARILYYDFFSGLFLYDLLINRSELLLKQISILEMQPLLEEDKNIFHALKKEILNNGTKNILTEHTKIFLLPLESANDIGEKKGKKNKFNNNEYKEKKTSNIPLYLSYYVDGTISGSGLVIAKNTIKKSRVRLNTEIFKESEEHLGVLLTFCRYLLHNMEFNLQKEVLNECIKPMIYKIISNILEKHNGSVYSQVALLMQTFMELEFALIDS